MEEIISRLILSGLTENQSLSLLAKFLEENAELYLIATKSL